MTDWNDKYKAKVREFMVDHGRPVEFVDRWYTGDLMPSIYGWEDHSKQKHIKPWQKGERGCAWIVPIGATLTEETYSQFDGTDFDNLMEVGVNVSGCHCACGELQGVTLRWIGSVTEMLHSILGLPDRKMEVTL